MHSLTDLSRYVIYSYSANVFFLLGVIYHFAMIDHSGSLLKSICNDSAIFVLLTNNYGLDTT